MTLLPSGSVRLRAPTSAPGPSLPGRSDGPCWPLVDKAPQRLPDLAVSRSHARSVRRVGRSPVAVQPERHVEHVRRLHGGLARPLPIAPAIAHNPGSPRASRLLLRAHTIGAPPLAGASISGRTSVCKQAVLVRPRSRARPPAAPISPLLHNRAAAV